MNRTENLINLTVVEQEVLDFGPGSEGLYASKQ